MVNKYIYFALGNAALYLRESMSTLLCKGKGQQGVWWEVLGSDKG